MTTYPAETIEATGQDSYRMIFLGMLFDLGRVRGGWSVRVTGMSDWVEPVGSLGEAKHLARYLGVSYCKTRRESIRATQARL